MISGQTEFTALSIAASRSIGENAGEEAGEEAGEKAGEDASEKDDNESAVTFLGIVKALAESVRKNTEAPVAPISWATWKENPPRPQRVF